MHDLRDLDEQVLRFVARHEPRLVASVLAAATAVVLTALVLLALLGEPRPAQLATMAACVSAGATGVLSLLARTFVPEEYDRRP